MPFLDLLSIQEVPGTRNWRLTAPLEYEGEREMFTVPVGYVTDFASVPRFLHWLISPYGAYTRAAVVHDWLITDEIPARRVTSRDTDGIFRRVMREEGVPFARRWLMWAAVRAASLFNPKRAYGRAFHRDAPAVIGIGMLFLLSFFPPLACVFVLIALAFVRLLGGGR